MGQQEKRRIEQKGRPRRPAPSEQAEPGIAEPDKQSAPSAPGKEQPAPQAAPPPAAEPAVPPTETLTSNAGDHQSPAAPEDALDIDEQPTPPRLPIVPKESPDPAPASDQTWQTAVSREQWTPPSTEETVGKFLSDIAEIAPLPARERQESLSPAFFPIPSVSSEAASRKKASATPFLSEIQSATSAPGAKPKRPRKRARSLRRRRAIWAAVIAGMLVLIVLAALLAFVLLRH